MRTTSLARLAALVAAVSVVAGCSAANGAVSSTAAPLQLRLVTSSAQDRCSAAPLTSAGPGSACNSAGTTTYELGESLGVVTPTSVTRTGRGAGQTVDVMFDTADGNTLAEVTRAAVGKQLALLAEGRVLSAPRVAAAITGGALTFSFGTAAEADQVAAALGATAPPPSAAP